MEVIPVKWKITYVWCGGIDAMPCERVFDDYAEAEAEYESMKRDPDMFQRLERPYPITGKSLPLAQVTTRANRLCRAENDSLKKLLLALSDMVRFADSSYTGDGIKPLLDWLSDTAHLYEKR